MVLAIDDMTKPTKDIFVTFRVSQGRGHGPEGNKTCA